MRNIYFSKTDLSAPNVEGLDVTICMGAGNMFASTAIGKARLQRGRICTASISRWRSGFGQFI